MCKNEVKDSDQNLDIAGQFLIKTVIPQLRLIKRCGTAYHAVNKWRVPLKEHQIDAVKLVKKYRPPAMVDRLSEQLCEASSLIFGKNPVYVTNVACGHGGLNCFAQELAKNIADKAALEYVDVFPRLPVSGTSHPKKNADRPAMQVIDVPDAPVLLVDDIATSGSHICEATEKLRELNCSVFPLAWIAS